MAVHINEVFEYLDEHPIHSFDGGVESLMEMIYEVYAERNITDTKEIRKAFGEFEDLLRMLPKESANQLYSVFVDLCRQHEVLAFTHGIVVGMHLMTEVNYCL